MTGSEIPWPCGTVEVAIRAMGFSWDVVVVLATDFWFSRGWRVRRT